MNNEYKSIVDEFQIKLTQLQELAKNRKIFESLKRKQEKEH